MLQSMLRELPIASASTRCQLYAGVWRWLWTPYYCWFWRQDGWRYLSRSLWAATAEGHACYFSGGEVWEWELLGEARLWEKIKVEVLRLVWNSKLFALHCQFFLLLDMSLQKEDWRWRNFICMTKMQATSWFWHGKIHGLWQIYLWDPAGGHGREKECLKAQRCSFDIVLTNSIYRKKSQIHYIMST